MSCQFAKNPHSCENHSGKKAKQRQDSIFCQNSFRRKFLLFRKITWSFGLHYKSTPWLHPHSMHLINVCSQMVLIEPVSSQAAPLGIQFIKIAFTPYIETFFFFSADWICKKRKFMLAKKLLFVFSSHLVLERREKQGLNPAGLLRKGRAICLGLLAMYNLVASKQHFGVYRKEPFWYQLKKAEPKKSDEIWIVRH